MEAENHTPHSHHAGEAHVHAPAAHSTHPPAQVPNPTNKALAIGIVLVLVVLIVGVLVFTKLTQNNTPPEQVVQPVKVKLIVDQSCIFCPKTNTILAKFTESGIQYDLNTIDVHSPEGQQLVKDFDLDYVPTALLSIAGLDQNSTVQAALQGQFINDPPVTKKGWIILPEKFLDKQPKIVTFLKEQSACEVPAGKILITAQLDYGDCKPCIEAQKILNALTGKYDNVEVEYRPIMYNRPTLPEVQAAFLTNKGAVCADKLGYLNAYTECNYFNAQFHGNLDINFMKSCIEEAGATSKAKQDAFVSCVQDENSGADQMLIENTKTGILWNPIKYTPSFIIDCTYSFVGQNSLPAYLCSIHPELEGCSELIDSILHPPVVDVNSSTPDVNSAVDSNADAGLTDLNAVDSNAS